jgi:hypothetical protein
MAKKKIREFIAGRCGIVITNTWHQMVAGLLMQKRNCFAITIALIYTYITIR